MAAPLFTKWAGVAKPVIGMVHLRPLPGSPRFAGDLAGIRDAALRDAEALLSGGVQGLIVENYGDAPFYPRRVPAQVATHMTRIACELRRICLLPMGVNVLRNDGRTGLAVAQAADADFIRLNVLCGARVTDQGIIEGIAHALLRDRARYGAAGIRIFADVTVKHSAPLGPPRPIEDEVGDAVERGGADAIVVSGSATGKPADLDQLCRASDAARRCIPPARVFVGSGVTAESVAGLGLHADGFIVGTSLKIDEQASNPVDPQRVRRLMDAVRSIAAR